MRAGIYLPPFGVLGDPRTLTDLAVRAEAAGWEGFFLWDHVVCEPGMPVADPWIALACIASATDRILLGTMVTPLPRRRPWVVARQAAGLSQFSGGRFVLGVGSGSDEFGDFSRFGELTDLRTRARMLDESLEIIEAMWHGMPVHHRGSHYEVTLDAAQPLAEMPPIWVACTLPATRALIRAARYGGVVPVRVNADTSPEDVAMVRKALPAQAIVVRGNASPAWPDEHSTDLAGLAEAGATWWLEALIHYDPLELTREVIDAGPPRADGR